MSDHPFFRTVWWCWVVNEPAFLTHDWVGRRARCDNCGIDSPDDFPDEAFQDRHTYVGFVSKPGDSRIDRGTFRQVNLNGA